MFAEMLDPNEKQTLYKLAEFMILADGKIDEEEKKYLDILYSKISSDAKNLTLEAIFDISRDYDNSKKRAIITELLIIAKCDRDYADSEKDLMTTISENFGIPDEVVSELDAWTDKYMQIMDEGTNLVNGF